MSLISLKPGARATITKFNGDDHDLATRLMEMGLTIGSQIEIAYEAPFGGAIAIRCRGSLIALRSTDAALIEVTPLKEQL